MQDPGLPGELVGQLPGLALVLGGFDQLVLARLDYYDHWVEKGEGWDGPDTLRAGDFVYQNLRPVSSTLLRWA